jgi:ATP-dependent Clp protease adaptor protein ClpS
MPAFFRALGKHGKKQYIRAHYIPTMSATPRTDEEVRELLRLLPRYRVLLHNDDVHAMDEVVLALVRTVPALSIEAATAIMFEAHNTGRAQVVICPREPAEYYRERLESFSLTSTIEPV